MFHNRAHGPFGHGRPGNFLDRRRLTQLYNDTKLSYENARTTPSNAPFENDPDVLSLKKEFQMQQDRLLAWGMHWADKQSNSNAPTDSKVSGDVEIDKKVDQAGLGDVVASIMESIKSMLEESGRMSHPGRLQEGKSGNRKQSFKDKFVGTGNNPAFIPKSERKEWKEYEMTTGRTLLEKLTMNIDLLYDLIQDPDHKRNDDEYIESSGMDKKKYFDDHAHDRGFGSRKVTVDEMLGSLATGPAPPAPKQHPLQAHPYYIDLARLEPMHDPNAAEDPPSYDDVKDNAAIQPRAIYYFPAMQAHVLVDLVKARDIPVDALHMGEGDPHKQMYELARKMSGKGLLTWDGHLKLLGFTLAAASSRFGLVYALPAPNDPTALQNFQTLTTSIAATLEHDMSLPPLENKVRLAYNIALTATGYLAHNECHGQIKSSNIIFLRENDNPKLGPALRCPYLLQPVQKLVGESSVAQPLSSTIYHHPDADDVGYGKVPAYDIYSVGLILLEIGLWRPLTTFWKPKYDRHLFAERLRKVYSPKLASKCGSRYMKLVQKCMDAPEFLMDKPSPVDAAEYLLAVVEDMATCCALDEAGPPSELDIDVFEALIEEQRLSMPEVTQSKPSPQPVSVKEVPTTAPPNLVKQDSMSTRSKQKPAESLRKWPELEIPQEHLETWNTMLMPKISKILKSALKDSVESCSVSLMMIGSTPEKAKTTICVQCRNTARVRETLCQRFKPKRGWGLVVCPGEIRRSGQIRRKRGTTAKRSGAGAGAANTEEPRPRKTREQHYQPRPGCGASIGAFKDEQHLPPVSFGGTILVDGEPFGMTVHHMLDEPSDSESESESDEDLEVPRRSTAPRSSARMTEIEADLRFMQLEDAPVLDNLVISDDSDQDGSDGDDDDDIESNSDASTIRPDYAMMDEEGNEFFFLDDSSEGSAPDLDDDEYSSGSEDENDDETQSIGDKPGFAPYTFDEDDLCITQPAIDDVDDDFFPSMEDRDDDHLASHSFGYVHASSGIKRVKRNEVKHEVDWALIRINDDRISINVTVPGAPERRSSSMSSKMKTRQRKQMVTEPLLVGITPMSALSRLHVTSVGRTSGLKRGRISQAMSLVKFRGRTSFSSSYTVEGGFGVPGDSGAWVYNEEKQELCGHVLAWGSGLKVAFISPMEVIFEDLRKCLEADTIALPGSVSSTAPSVPIRQPPMPALITARMTTETQSKGKASVPPTLTPSDSLEKAMTAGTSEKQTRQNFEKALQNLHFNALPSPPHTISSFAQTYDRGNEKKGTGSVMSSHRTSDERSPTRSRPTSSAGMGSTNTLGGNRGKDVFDMTGPVVKKGLSTSITTARDGSTTGANAVDGLVA